MNYLTSPNYLILGVWIINNKVDSKYTSVVVNYVKTKFRKTNCIVEIWGQSYYTCFLKNRSQKVKIGSCISKSVNLESGVPQGRILSPLIFVLYLSDLEDWLNH